MHNLESFDIFKENNRFEAKRAVGGLPQSIWQTYSAFANTSGGVILLGVDEAADKSLSVVGLDNPEKLIADFWNTINNPRKVSVNILSDKHVRILEYGERRVIGIEVPRANRADRPVYTGADPFAGTRRRNGEGDFHCNREEVRAMMRDQTNVSQDTKVLTQLDLSAFDYDSIRRYRIQLQNLRPNHVWEKLEASEFLQKIGCVGRAENGALCPTAAGILMFGYENEITKEFPEFFLDYQEHADDSTRWTDRVVSGLGEACDNIYDFFFRVSSRITQEVKTPFKLDGLTRVDNTPVHDALREALANALIHADYYGRRGLVIHHTPHKKIIVSNPGGLRPDLNDVINGGISDPRNSTLMKLFNLIRVSERAGSGIPSIYSVWEQQGYEKPALEEQFNPDRMVLTLILSREEDERVEVGTNDGTNGTNGTNVGTNDCTDGTNVGTNGTNIGTDGTNDGTNQTRSVLNEIVGNPKISMSEISQSTSIPRRTVARIIKKLQKDETIKRIGSTRGHWEVVNMKTEGPQ